MKFISHRGNLNGENTDTENSVNHIIHLLDSYNYDIEIDIRYNKKTNLIEIGHDNHRELDILSIDNFVNLFFKYNKRLWIHCKNIESIVLFSKIENKFNYFGHSDDEFVLTSFGDIFTKPGIYNENAIIVMPELVSSDLNLKCKGILTNFPIKYETHYNSIRS